VVNRNESSHHAYPPRERYAARRADRTKPQGTLFVHTCIQQRCFHVRHTRQYSTQIKEEPQYQPYHLIQRANMRNELSVYTASLLEQHICVITNRDNSDISQHVVTNIA
jgi:hypothetical protein